MYLTHLLTDARGRFPDEGTRIIGICNGFQAMLKAGLLLPPDEDGPLATLANNDSGHYEDRWVYLQATPGNCPFLKGIERIHVPIGHGEGKFVCRKEWIARGLDQAGQVVLRYVDGNGNRGGYPVNPNGSQDDIAGHCDATRRAMGSHAARTATPLTPSTRARGRAHGLKAEGDGLQIFRECSGVLHAKGLPKIVSPRRNAADAEKNKASLSASAAFSAARNAGRQPFAIMPHASDAICRRPAAHRWRRGIRRTEPFTEWASS